MSLLLSQVLAKNSNALWYDYDLKMSAITQYMRHMNLPLDLRSMVAQHYSLQWSLQFGKSDEQLLTAMPPHLRVRVLTANVHRLTTFVAKLPQLKGEFRRLVVVRVVHGVIPRWYALPSAEEPESLLLVSLDHVTGCESDRALLSAITESLQPVVYAAGTVVFRYSECNMWN